MLGIAALAIAGLASSLIAATPAQAAGTWLPLQAPVPGPGGVACNIRTGEAYPGNGHLYYCGPQNRLNIDGAAVLNKIKLEPAPVLTALSNEGVTIYIFKSWADFQTYTGRPLPTINGQTVNPATEPAFSDIPISPGSAAAKSFIMQFLDGPLGSGTVPIYSAITGLTQHELGHQLDRTLNPPSLQTWNSQQTKSNGVDTIFRAKMKKDETFIDGQARCTGIFQTDQVQRGRELVQIGGTKRTGDVLSITVSNSNLAGGQRTVSYMVKSTDTLATIATGLIAAIHGDAVLKAFGADAISAGIGYANIFVQLDKGPIAITGSVTPLFISTTTMTLTAQSPALISVCQGTNLLAPYSGTNVQVLHQLYPYYFNSDTTNGFVTYSEFWAEMYSVLSSSGTSLLEPGKSFDKYLKDYYRCTNFFVKGMRNNGMPPVNTTYIFDCQ